MPFTHVVRPRYAEVDQQGVVFNAHWLTYFDEANTRFWEHLGYSPKEVFLSPDAFDMMLVKAVVEWKGPAGFDEEVLIDVEPVRLGNSSLDFRYTARVDDRVVCEAVITYVSVRHGANTTEPIPDEVRAKLTERVPA